jgi:hypothetical protein
MEGRRSREIRDMMQLVTLNVKHNSFSDQGTTARTNGEVENRVH